MNPWNKGKTKKDDPRIESIAKKMASRKRSNFYEWQKDNKPNYKKIVRNKNLAELYGTILGDGCMEKFPRTDKLSISFNRKEQDHIKHIEKIITKVIGKQPSVRVRKEAQCDDLYLYQKHLSSRLNFPYGCKLKNDLKVPGWIKISRLYLKHCLKGIFESDGDWVKSKKYGTNVIKFNNRSQSLLNDIYKILKKLNFNPQRRKLDVRIAQNKKVAEFTDWIKFRKY